MRGDARLLTRYWIEFDTSTDELHRQVSRYGASRGCGVTAYSYQEALDMVRLMVFRDDPLPTIIRIVENVDIRTLDQGRIVPNMAPPVWRGIWYPLGWPL